MYYRVFPRHIFKVEWDGRGLGGVCNHIKWFPSHIKVALTVKAEWATLPKGPGYIEHCTRAPQIIHICVDVYTYMTLYIIYDNKCTSFTITRPPLTSKNHPFDSIQSRYEPYSIVYRWPCILFTLCFVLISMWSVGQFYHTCMSMHLCNIATCTCVVCVTAPNK